MDLSILDKSLNEILEDIRERDILKELAEGNGYCYDDEFDDELSDEDLEILKEINSEYEDEDDF